MLDVNGIRIITDPVLCPAGIVHNYGLFKSRRIVAPVFSEDDIKDIDLWLFTHGHKDHCDFGKFKPITSESKIVSDVSASKKLKRYTCGDIQGVGWGEKTTVSFSNGIEMVIEAVPAVHALNVRKGRRIGNGNGWVLD